MVPDAYAKTPAPAQRAREPRRMPALGQGTILPWTESSQRRPDIPVLLSEIPPRASLRHAGARGEFPSEPTMSREAGGVFLSRSFECFSFLGKKLITRQKAEGFQEPMENPAGNSAGHSSRHCSWQRRPAPRLGEPWPGGRSRVAQRGGWQQAPAWREAAAICRGCSPGGVGVGLVTELAACEFPLLWAFNQRPQLPGSEHCRGRLPCTHHRLQLELASLCAS